MNLLNRNTPPSQGVGRVRAVILDWAGTTLDFGSLAPAKTLERVFVQAGVQLKDEEIRQNMGIAKRDHIAAILSIPRVRQEWRAVRMKEPADADVSVLYKEFLPLQFDCLRQYARLIKGVAEVVEALRLRSIKIGSTTGYTRAMLDILVEEASRQGYRPDCAFSPEDAGGGRPHPYMIFAAAVRMQVYPLSAFIKVGDTESDIAEALNAGAWAVGVAATGNGIGLSEDDFLALPDADRNARLQRARDALQAVGAHFVIDTLADLPAVIHEVERA